MPYPSFQSSPLLLHHPPALANTGNNAFQMPSTPSRSASPFTTATASGSASGPAHQIPFNATPVHHAPSPLGFGFGFGSSFGNNNLTPQTTPHPSLSATSALAMSFASPSASASHSPRRGDTKRRRDLDEDDEDDEDMDQSQGHQSISPRLRSSPSASELIKRPLASKRMRGGIPHAGPPFSTTTNGTANRIGWSASAESQAVERGATASGKRRISGLDVDLGKMLASLDRASLLSVLTNLIAQSKDPNLGAQILALLPAPSLESVEAALEEAEKNVRAAIPFVMAGGAANVRDEYTWSRVRGPLAAFSDTALSYLPFFVSDADSEADASAVGSSSAKREQVHPATTFTFLQALTLRILRLHALLPSVPKSSLAFSSSRPDRASTSFGFGFGASSAAAGGSSAASSESTKHSNLAERIPSMYTSPVSPDALLCTLLPALLKQWTILVERLDRAVNVEGRMFGQEVVLGWARALDAVNSRSQHGGASSAGPVAPKPEETVIREAMDEVRNRLERDLGWLVGGGPGPAVSRPAPQAGQSAAAAPSHQQEHHAAASSNAAPSRNAKRTRGTSMDDDEEEL